MTTEEIIIDLKLNGDQSSKSLNQLEQDLVNLKSALKNVAVGSDDFKKLQAEVIKADSKVKNLNKSIEGLDTEAMAGEIGKFAGGVSASFTAVAAVIGSSSGEFEKFTQNIVTGIAVTQGLKGAQEALTSGLRIAKQAQIAFNAAMAANPIGLMVAAIAALVAGIYLLTKAMGDNGEEQVRLNKLQREYNKVVLESTINSNKLAIELAKVLKLNKELYNEQKNQIDLEFQKTVADLASEYGNLAPLLEENKNLINQLTEAQNALNAETDTGSARYEQLEDAYEKIDEALDRNIEKMDLEIKAAGKNVDERDKLIREFAVKSLSAEETRNKKLIILTVQQGQEERALTRKNNEELLKFDREREENLKGILDKITSLIRANINTRLQLELDSFSILNFQRAGLADFEIELLERNFKLTKKQREEDRQDRIKDLRQEINDIKFNYDEKQRLLREDARETEKYLQDSFNEGQKLLDKDLKEKRLSQSDYNEYKKDAEKRFNEQVSDNLDDFLKKEKEINDARIELVGKTQKELEKLKKSDGTVEKAELEKLEAEKQVIRDKFRIQLIDETRKTQGEIFQLLISSAEEEIDYNTKLIKANKLRNDLYIKGLILYKDEVKTTLQFEEDAEKARLNISINTNRRILEERLRYFEQSEEKTKEQEELIKIINNQLIALEEERSAKQLAIRLRFNKRAIEIEDSILKSQITSLQANLDRQLRLREGHWSEVYQLTVRRLESQKQLELTTAKEKYEADLKLAKDNKDKQLEITQEYENTKESIENDFRQKSTKANIDAYKKAIDVGKQLFADFQAIQLNLTTDRINKELRAREAALEQEVRALDGAVEAGIMSEDAKKDALNKIDFERAAAQRKAAHDQAKAEKKQALVKVAIDTATAIVEAAPVIPLQILAAIVGASQAAVIASQPLPQLKRGGRIKGPSHENGGVPLYKNGTQIAEVEGDELIMTKGVAQSPVLLNMASTLNQLAGGISFDNQPMGVTPAGTMPMSVATIDEASLIRVMKNVTSIPVTNVSTDTDRVTRKVRNIEARSRF
jgi:hypothetical protein